MRIEVGLQVAARAKRMELLKDHDYQRSQNKITLTAEQY